MITISWTAIIILLLVWFFVAMLNHTASIERYKKALRAPGYEVLQEEAEEEMKRLRTYLRECMEGRSEEDWKLFDYYLEKSKPVIGSSDDSAVLIRLLHKLGGELVARQKANSDIEPEENKGDAYWEYYTGLKENEYKLYKKHFKIKDI